MSVQTTLPFHQIKGETPLKRKLENSPASNSPEQSPSKVRIRKSEDDVGRFRDLPRSLCIGRDVRPVVRGSLLRVEGVMDYMKDNVQSKRVRTHFDEYGTNILLVLTLSYHQLCYSATPFLKIPFVHDMLRDWENTVNKLSCHWLNLSQRKDTVPTICEGAYALFQCISRRRGLLSETLDFVSLNRIKAQLTNLFRLASSEPLWPEWAKRKELTYTSSGEPQWGNLTMMVTHQWFVSSMQNLKGENSPEAVIRYVISIVLPINEKYLPLQFRKKGGDKKHTLCAIIEGRMYLYTHIVLVCSGWGGKLTVLTKEEAKAIAEILGVWFKALNHDHNRESHNREVTAELAACLLILKGAGVMLDKKTLDHLVDYKTRLMKVYHLRKAGNLADLQAGSKGALMVSHRSNGAHALYVDYHAHYLVALFLSLFSISSLEDAPSTDFQFVSHLSSLPSLQFTQNRKTLPIQDFSLPSDFLCESMEESIPQPAMSKLQWYNELEGTLQLLRVAKDMMRHHSSMISDYFPSKRDPGSHKQKENIQEREKTINKDKNANTHSDNSKKRKGSVTGNPSTKRTKTKRQKTGLSQQSLPFRRTKFHSPGIFQKISVPKGADLQRGRPRGLSETSKISSNRTTRFPASGELEEEVEEKDPEANQRLLRLLKLDKDNSESHSQRMEAIQKRNFRGKSFRTQSEKLSSAIRQQQQQRQQRPQHQLSKKLCTCKRRTCPQCFWCVYDCTCSKPILPVCCKRNRRKCVKCGKCAHRCCTCSEKRQPELNPDKRLLCEITTTTRKVETMEPMQDTVTEYSNLFKGFDIDTLKVLLGLDPTVLRTSPIPSLLPTLPLSPCSSTLAKVSTQVFAPTSSTALDLSLPLILDSRGVNLATMLDATQVPVESSSNTHLPDSPTLPALIPEPTPPFTSTLNSANIPWLLSPVLNSPISNPSSTTGTPAVAHTPFLNRRPHKPTILKSKTSRSQTLSLPISPFPSITVGPTKSNDLCSSGLLSPLPPKQNELTSKSIPPTVKIQALPERNLIISENTAPIPSTSLRSPTIPLVRKPHLPQLSLSSHLCNLFPFPVEYPPMPLPSSPHTFLNSHCNLSPSISLSCTSSLVPIPTTT